MAAAYIYKQTSLYIFPVKCLCRCTAGQVMYARTMCNISDTDYQGKPSVGLPTSSSRNTERQQMDSGMVVLVTYVGLCGEWIKPD